MYLRTPTGASLLVLALACLVASPATPAFAEAPKAEATKSKKKVAETKKPETGPQEVAPAELPAIDVTARGEVKPAIPENIPATVVGTDREQIRTEVNGPTTAAALRYLPSVEVRERYIGDRNGILATRTTGTIESARSLVYGDGILLSNLLGNSYSFPPRWGAVSPWEVERVDMVYGPFAAAYPGNSMGGVASIATRMPEKFEAHATLRGWAQPYSLYGTKETYPGWNGSFAIGNRLEAFSFWLGWDHLDAKGQPMSFSTSNTPTVGVAATNTVVTGATFDKDYKNVDRTVYGATGIDHTVQDMLKLKAAWDISDTLRATWTSGLWLMNANTSVESYLRTATGAVFTGNANDCKFSIATTGGFYNYNSAACQNPGKSESAHLLNGFQLKSSTGGVFDWEASVSAYDYLADESRSASNYGTTGVNKDKGTKTDLRGSGWYTADLRGIWRPDANLFGRHEVTFGTHYDLYRHRSSTWNTTNWSTGNGATFSSAAQGNTETAALFLQDSWRFLPNWTVTAGLRAEAWSASDGRNTQGATVVDHARRTYSDLSPKLALSYRATEEILLRAAYGKAHRYPTVSELFQYSKDSSGTVVLNTPGLKPENIDAYEISGEWAREGSKLRLTGFAQDNRDAIAAQQECANAACTATVSWTNNVGRVAIWGSEIVAEQRDAFVSGLDLKGSVTLTWSKILENAAAPTYIGKEWVRTPRWRARAVATYRWDDAWSGSLGMRYSSGAYNTADNSDQNWSGFSSNSSYLVFDTRVTRKVGENWSVAFGIDNLTDAKAYVHHPYPQRTFFSEIKVDF